MKIFKYMTSDGIDVIQNLRLLVQDPNNFNDPFEFTSGVDDLNEKDLVNALQGAYGERIYSMVGGEKTGLSLEEFRNNKLLKDEKIKIISKDIPDGMYKEYFEFKKIFGSEKAGVICFTSEDVKPVSEILLWSHYANSHTGLRVLFDSDKIILKSNNLDNVEYLDKRVLLNPLSIRTNPDAAEEIFSKLLFQKSKVWKYEKEFRWLIGYIECHYEFDGAGVQRNYIQIEPDAILQVDLGVRMKNEVKEAIKSLLSHADFSHVKCSEVELDRKRYALNYMPLTEKKCF